MGIAHQGVGIAPPRCGYSPRKVWGSALRWWRRSVIPGVIKETSRSKKDSNFIHTFITRNPNLNLTTRGIFLFFNLQRQPCFHVGHLY